MKNDLLTQSDLHHKLFHNVLANFTDEETNRRPFENNTINHVKYIAGHLTNAQYVFAMLADVEVERKWDDLFAGMGQSEAEDDITYPTIEQIKTEWDATYEKTKPALEKLSEDDLIRTAPEPLGSLFEEDPIVKNTVSGVWAFFNHHQAYHIGQIGLLRKSFGKNAMSYS